MQRIINNPKEVVEDMAQGFIKANPKLISPTNHPRVIKYKDAPVENKVGIVTGDVVINPEASVLIMTTEIFRNSLFDNSSRFH